MASDDSSKKPRSYYVDYTNKKFHRNAKTSGRLGANTSRFNSTPDISSGNRGFIVTAIDEVKCYMEIRCILEEYYESIYEKKDNKDSEEKPKLEQSIDDELDSELKHRRQTRPFKQLKTCCRNTIFLNIVDKFKEIDPIVIVDRFFDDLKNELRTSNTYKILPVLDTFRPTKVCAKESIQNQLLVRFKDDEGQPKKYFIEFQTRGNYKLNPDDKMDLINTVAETISELRSNWTVSRESADYMIILVAFRNVCCLSIVTDYFARRRYNIVEFCKPLMGGQSVDRNSASECDHHETEQEVQLGDSNRIEK